MINSKSITKLINAKRLKHQAIMEMLPDGIRKQNEKCERAVKEIVKGVISAVYQNDLSSDNTDTNKEDKPHKVDINF